MQRTIIVLTFLATAAWCADPVPIISQESNIEPDGRFQWSFEAGDGTKQQQTGELKAVGQEQGQTMQGSASWTDNEGKAHSLTYVADENGYQPQGEDVPQIPPAIQKALEWNAAHPQEERRRK